MIQDQAPKGKGWDYSLKEVYFIGIMDYVLEDSDPAECVHYVHLTYEKTGKEFYKKLGLIFIEIPKFTKTEKELKTGVDKWLFVLKNMSRLKKIPLILHTRIFSKLFNIAAVSNLTKENYMKYEKDLMAYWDEYAIKKTIEHDLQVAKEEGREEGMERGKAEIVLNLINKFGFNDEQASSAAEVSIAFVKKVRASLKKKR